MASGPDWARLGNHVTARRVALGMNSVRALSAATKKISPRGISERSLGKLENGRGVPYRSTLAMVEMALGWAPGSAQDILGGGEPTEVKPADDRPQLVIDNWGDEVVRAMWRLNRPLETRLGIITRYLADAGPRDKDTHANGAGDAG